VIPRAVVLAAAVAAAVPSSAGQPAIALSPLGEAVLPSEPDGDGPVIGGLSGLAWDPQCDLYWAVSDDPGLLSPPRLHLLRIGAASGRLGEGDLEVVDTIVLRARDLDDLRREGPDLEAIALAPDGSMLLASEGGGPRAEAPWVRRFARNGDLLDELPLPAHLLPTGSRRSGARRNLSFEGLSLAPDGRTLMLATENAAVQDGPRSDLGVPSPSRIVVMDLHDGRVLAEHVWMVEPVPDEPVPEDGYRINGISEILAVDRHRLLVLERSFSVGVGNTVRIYLGELETATDVAGVASLAELPAHRLRPVAKTLLLDLGQAGIDPDNLEGMALGPRLPDGRRALVLVADNNFNPFGQVNQVVLLAADGLDPPFDPTPERVTVPQLQGAAHVSPWVGRCVAGVAGIVTAVDADRDVVWAWIQSPDGDGDAATSDAVRLGLPSGPVPVAPGDLVEVEGRVEEVADRADLPVTTLWVRTLERIETGRVLPLPVRIGAGGRAVPPVFHDGGQGFEPDERALDLYESLEGMRVELPPSIVTGPSSRFGEVWVLPEDAAGALPRTLHGGVRLVEGVDAPQRLALDDPLTGPPPRAVVGDRLPAPPRGILHWAFGAWRVLVTEPWPAVLPGGVRPEATAIRRADDLLTVATVNLENLSARSDPSRFETYGRLIADALASPDVVALQEVQDDTGPLDDGTVSAGETLDRLVAAISAAGGPSYRWTQVDPVDGADGGQPGGNIRVAVLLDPSRVELVERGGPGPERAVAVVDGPALAPSPGRVGPGEPALVESRKPLAVQLRVAGRSVFLFNLHLASKRGDDPQAGRRQPPERATEAKRLAQARLVAELAGEILGQDPGAAVVVLGDLNEHEWRPPVEALEAVGLVNLVERLAPEDRYTYVFQGRSQVLDHVLVSPSLAAGAQVDAVHLNADFPAAGRASDHDPVVVGLMIR